MTTFSLHGAFRGHTATITWTDGHLSGDPEVVALVEHLAKQAEGKPVWTPEYQGPMTDHLSDPYQAFALMKMALAFTPRPILIGALPPLPSPPDGAVP